MEENQQPLLATDDPAFTGLRIVYMRADELEPYTNNARTHSEDQVEQLKASLNEFGFTNPVLLDGKRLLAGHGRTIAALDIFKKGGSIKMCPPGQIPTIDLSHLTPVQQRAYIIADNKLAENAGWDYNILKIEIDALGELGFDLDLLGFGAQLAELLAPSEENEGLTDPDEVPPVPDEPVSIEGDVWLLGRHRLVCGDSTQTDLVMQLMDGTRADMLHTDPPYGVSYKGGQKEWDGIKNDALTDDSLVDFLYEAFASAVPATKPGAPWYVWHADMTTAEFVKALKMVDRKLSSHIIWVKNQMGGGWGDYRAKHEPCIYSSGGKSAWYGGRDQSTVWNVDRERDYVHPTQKPVELVRRAIDNSSKAGDAVLDLFGGSGSTLIGCEQSGRTAYLMELDPRYVDTIVLRWQGFTGQNAVLESDGRTFTEILAERKPNAVLTPSSEPPASKPKRAKRAKATA
jgi:DNA modification methylase